jgi:hypothetical protein
MIKDLYQVVDDLFGRLPLYAVDNTRVVEIDEDTIEGVVGDRVVVNGNYYFKIDDLKATREEALIAAGVNINEFKKKRVEQITEAINRLSKELKELLK